MTNLDALPAEVLLEIVSNMRKMRDLAALSMQCRRLHQIVDMPKFRQFHRIRIPRGITIDECKQVSDIVRQILRNPKLGWYVRQLEVHDPPGYSNSQEEMGTEDSEDVRLVGRAIEIAGLGEHKDQLVQSFFTQSGESESVMGVLLMTMCPNIDTLQICDTQFPLEDFLKKNNSKNALPQFLRRLRTVKVLHSDVDDHRFYGVTDIMAMMKLFHRLPSIETISASGTSIDKEYGMYRLAPRKSNFSRIHFDHSAIEDSELESMIQSCKKLDKLKYSIGGRATMEDSDARVVPKTLGQALRQHKSTLRSLDLDIDHIVRFVYGIQPDGEPAIPESDDDSEEEDEDRIDSELEDDDDDNHNNNGTGGADGGTPEKFGRTIGSFREFTALKRLSIGINVLIGSDPGEYPPPFRVIDALPPNLEYLCIRGYQEGANKAHTDMVKEFLEHKAERFPQLQEVEGIRTCIPSAKHVKKPDENRKLLFPVKCENEWAPRDDESDSD